MVNASWGQPFVHYRPRPLSPPYGNETWQPEIFAFGGPSEHDVEVMADNRTIMMVIRMDGDDVCSTDSYQYYHASFSSDNGRSWSRPNPINGTGCARPRLRRLTAGPLLMTGGRLCVENTTGLFLWLNQDGAYNASANPRDSWSRHSISYQHNRLWEGPERFKFSEAVNSTVASDRPLFDMESQAYTSILPTGPRSAAIFYNQFAHPRGHNSTTFVMHVSVPPSPSPLPLGD